MVGALTSWRLQASFHALPVALEWAATASSATAALGAQEMQWVKVLDKGPDYRYTPCQGTVRRLDGRPQREVQVGPDKLEVVASFFYLENMLSAAAGCELSTTTCVKTAWKKFKELLLVLSSHHLSFTTHSHVYSSCAGECNAPCQWDLTICLWLGPPWFNYWFTFTLAYSRISHEYSSLFIIVINLIFMFSLWCIDWVWSFYANWIFMYFCIKSSIGTQGEVS